MACLHELHVQVFKAKDGILLAKLASKLPMVCVALIGNFAMKPCKFQLCLSVIVRTSTLARQFAVCHGNGILLLLEEAWCDNVVFRALSYEHFPFEAKVETDAFTQSGF